MDIDFTILNSYKDESLRSYQQELKSKIYEEWQTKKSVMLQMPTGTGKTKLFCSIINDFFLYGKEIRKKGIKTLVLTHKEELVKQVAIELGQNYNNAYGIIQGKNMQIERIPVQIACVPTLIKRLDKWLFKDFDFIIVDEAHHIKANSYLKIIKAFDRAKLLGLTATPYRLSGEGFTKEFESLIVSPTIKEFQQDSYLSQYHYYSIGKDSFIQRTIDGIIKEDIQGDYDSNELIRLYDKDKIRAQIVETYQKYAEGKKGIVYTINQEHNKHLLNSFSEKGIKAAAIDSTTNHETRNELIEDFRKGKYDVLLNVNIFSEGFDCPDIEFIQLARPTKSLSMYLQQVGRGLRPHDNKDAVVILDNVGLYNRFGLPSAKRDWNFYFNGKDKDENRKHFVKRSLDKERRQREKDLSEGNEEVNLIYTSNEDLLNEEYAVILDPGIANEVAEYLYNRYRTIAKKVYEDDYSEYQLCKHELGYYFLKSKDDKNDVPQKKTEIFNSLIQEKLSRKGGKYFEIISGWNHEQLLLFEFQYNKIKITRYAASIWKGLFSNEQYLLFDLLNWAKEPYNQSFVEKRNKFYDMIQSFYYILSNHLPGYSRELHRMFCAYGTGDYVNNYLKKFLDYPNPLELFCRNVKGFFENSENRNFIFNIFELLVMDKVSVTESEKWKYVQNNDENEKE